MKADKQSDLIRRHLIRKPGRKFIRPIHGEYSKLYLNLLKDLKSSQESDRVSQSLVRQEHITTISTNRLAEDIAFKLTQNGYGVITGGGPGIMEAANRGAKRGNGKSVGINIDLPFEQRPNTFIDSDKLITFDHFFVRKVMFMKYAQGFHCLPGGFGTFDELFEAITLIQPGKSGNSL